MVKTNVGDSVINSYEIKKQNNEEILYIYLDFSNEFGNINFKEKKEELKDIIKKFIIDNKLAFTGTTVALVVGGTIIGNIVLNNDSKPNYNQKPIAIEEKIEDTSIEQELDEEKIVDNTKSEIVVEKETVDVSTPIQKGTNTINKNNDESSIVSNSVNIQKEVKVETPKEEVKDNEEPIDNNIYIKMKRSSGEIVTIELEEYLIGVVGAEMPAAFHDQALMAQAVIARTYALKANFKGQVLTDNESTQSYKDNKQLQAIWGSSYNTYYYKIKNAVINTKGLYLTYNGVYIEAVYHSTSNGMTEDSSNVWGNSFPYLVSVDSQYDSLNPSFLQEKTISYEELSSKLGTEVNINTEFNILNKTSGNRVGNIQINDKTYTGVSIRNLLALRSADFDITKTDTGVIFTTRGYGHGVGMSQYGANGMAKAGYSYQDILKHYYKGVAINHL